MLKNIELTMFQLRESWFWILSALTVDVLIEMHIKPHYERVACCVIDT